MVLLFTHENVCCGYLLEAPHRAKMCCGTIRSPQLDELLPSDLHNKHFCKQIRKITVFFQDERL